MTRLAAETWIRLGETEPRGDELTARLAIPDVSDRILAAIDASHRRHLLIVLTPDDAELRDSQSRGLGVTTSNLAVSGRAPTRYLDIACRDSAGHDALDIIGGELGQRLAAGTETPQECVSRVLAKWRRFWGQVPQSILAREEVLGLFAELWFLCFWLVPRVGPMEAVRRWRGPSGARHDFEWQRCSVEAKATTSVRGIVHSINGIEQLAPPEEGDLLLFSMRLREEGGATNSLPTLIDTSRTLLTGDESALAGLESRLNRAGYSPFHEDEYAKTKLRVVEEAVYRVDSDFPRITPSTVGGALPSGVEYVTYDINLSGFGHLIVAREPVGLQL
jgi:hypothetical protein